MFIVFNRNLRAKLLFFFLKFKKNCLKLLIFMVKKYKIRYVLHNEKRKVVLSYEFISKRIV